MTHLATMLREISSLNGSIADVYETAHDMCLAGCAGSAEELVIFCAEEYLDSLREAEDEKWLAQGWRVA